MARRPRNQPPPAAAGATTDAVRLLPQARIRLLGWVVGSFTSSAAEVQGAGGAAVTYDVVHVQAFTADGRYRNMRQPAVFLMGAGTGNPLPRQAGGEVNPGPLGLSQFVPGMVFAENLQYWEVDRSDDILRLDASAGKVQRVLLDVESGGQEGGRRVDLVGQESSFMARLGIDH